MSVASPMIPETCSACEHLLRGPPHVCGHPAASGSRSCASLVVLPDNPVTSVCPLRQIKALRDAAAREAALVEALRDAPTAHDPGCSGEFAEYRCKCGAREWPTRLRALLADSSARARTLLAAERVALATRAMFPRVGGGGIGREGSSWREVRVDESARREAAYTTLDVYESALHDELAER